MAGYVAIYDKTNASKMVLSTEQQRQNGKYIYSYMKSKYGWTLAAVSGMLGNIQAEATLNPSRPQNNAVKNQWWDSAPGRRGTAPNPTTTWYGFGIFQVTPWYAGPGTRRYNPYTLGNWALAKGYTASYQTCGTIGQMDIQLDWLVEASHISYRNPADNNRDQRKWYQDSRAAFNAPTPTEYGRSTASPEDCAVTFYWNFERSGAQDPGSRPAKAREWYTYLSGYDPDPDPPDPEPEPEPEPDPIIRDSYRNFIIVAKAAKLF